MNRYLAWQVRVSSLNIMLLVSRRVCKVEESHRDQGIAAPRRSPLAGCSRAW